MLMIWGSKITPIVLHRFGRVLSRQYIHGSSAFMDRMIVILTLQVCIIPSRVLDFRVS